MNTLAVSFSLFVSVLSLHHQIPPPFPKLILNIFSFSSKNKKNHSANAEAPSVVPEQTCSKGWTIFQVIHPHSGTEGCRLPCLVEMACLWTLCSDLGRQEGKLCQLFLPQAGAQGAGRKANYTRYEQTRSRTTPRIPQVQLVPYTESACLLRAYGQHRAHPASGVSAALCRTNRGKSRGLNILLGFTKCQLLVCESCDHN